jgi:hypothetical protein
MDLETENDWIISFNPLGDIDLPSFAAALKPWVILAERKTAERIELTLCDAPKAMSMQDVLNKALERLDEICPQGVVVGHIDDERGV